MSGLPRAHSSIVSCVNNLGRLVAPLPAGRGLDVWTTGGQWFTCIHIRAGAGCGCIGDDWPDALQRTRTDSDSEEGNPWRCSGATDPQASSRPALVASPLQAAKVGGEWSPDGDATGVGAHGGPWSRWHS